MSAHALKKDFNLGQFLERLAKEDRTTVNSGVLFIYLVLCNETQLLYPFSLIILYCKILFL